MVPPPLLANVDLGVEKPEEPVLTLQRSGSLPAPVAVPPIEIRLFGPLSVRRDGAVRPIPKSRKLRGLLAYLVLADRPVHRTVLCDLLWDGPNDPRGELRWCLSKLRALFDSPDRQRLEADRERVRLEPGDGFVDALSIRTLMGKALDNVAMEDLAVRAELFQGELLEGLQIERCPGFESWLTGQRQTFRSWRIQILQRLGEAGPPDNRLHYLQQWTELAPEDTRSHQAMIAFLARSGRVQDARERLEVNARILADSGGDAGPLRRASATYFLRPKAESPGSQDLQADHANAEISVRQGAAVAFVEVVDYARLAALNEAETSGIWAGLRRRIEPLVEERSGRIVQRLRDALLVEFQSAIDAVQWALAVQEMPSSFWHHVSSHEAMRLRIAVHVAEGDTAIGDGVDTAARLRGHAPPGGIALSEPVHELVRDILEYEAEDLGPLVLEDLQHPVRAFAIPSKTSQSRKPTALPSHRPSLAVLPFRSLGPDPIEPYFSEGLGHDIVASLGAFSELFVLSSYSTLRLAEEADRSARDLGMRLGVRYLVTGTASRRGSELRLSVELTDAETNSAIWSDRYDASANDLFAAQDAAATRIAYSLIPHLRQTELKRALRKPPATMDAYDLVLQALYRIYRFESTDHCEARRLLQRAVERDPDYAMAYALLAHWHVLEVGEGRSDAITEATAASRYSALALACNPSDPLALAISGHASAFLFGDLNRAINSFDLALASSPNSPFAWGMSSPTYSYLGDGPIAVARAEYGLRLSPLDPYIHIFQGYLGLAHYVNGSHEEAVYWSRRSLAKSPRFVAVLRQIIVSLSALGRLEEARVAAKQLVSLVPGFRVRTFMASYPIKDAQRAAAYAAQLLAAGLPE